MSHNAPASTATRVATPRRALWAQRLLAAAAVLALVFVLGSIAQQVGATQPAATPARVVTTTTDAGLYPLTVSFSRYPAAAGYALPFAIAPTVPFAGTLTYTVTAMPVALPDDARATPVNASLTRDPHTANRVTGAVEITVRGQWALVIAVDGPSGPDMAAVPIAAEASGVIPGWLAWLIGLIPAAAIALYFLVRRRAGSTQSLSQ